jgi:hypothetical protein
MDKMLSKLLLGITIITYVALIGVNLYKPKGTGDQLVGWGFVLFGVLAAYVVSSLMLTINIALKGEFNWISEFNIFRNSIIFIGWTCLMAGVVYCTMINADWHSTATSNWLGLVMIHYGAIWIPLLMLVPYVILLNPDLHNTLSPNLFKLPLLVGCLIGLAFHFLSNSQLGNFFKDKEAVNTLQFENAMKQIGFEESVVDLLYYLHKGTDVRLTQAALTKLKSKENLESELLKILNQCDNNYDYLRVFAYLENNKVEQPELFIAPLNKTIYKVSEELKYRLQSFGSENDFLKLLNVDGLCRILEMQFKTCKADFIPNMLKVQAELEKEPKPDFIEFRNKYKAAVKNWLDTP